MNICRYITGTESLSLSHIMIWNSIAARPPIYGVFILIDAPEWGIKLSYPNDRRKKRSHHIYVDSYSQKTFGYTEFNLYYITDLNMWVLKVKLK